MIKRTIKALSALTLLFTLTCCEKEDYVNDDTPQTPRREWYEIVKTDTLTAAELTQGLAGYSIPIIRSSVARVAFMYNSTDGTDSVRLSGTVTYPITRNNFNRLLLENHQFYVNDNEAPSQSSTGGMIISARSGSEGICITPEYQGLGLTSHMRLPYFNATLLARQSIDCFNAALTLITDLGIELVPNYFTYNFGFSLGGAVSAAIAREVELDPELDRTMHIKKSICGGGPYDPNALLEHYSSIPDDSIAYPIVIICALEGARDENPAMREAYSDTILYSRKLRESGLFEAIQAKQSNTRQLIRLIHESGCYTLREMVNPDLFDRESSLYRFLVEHNSRNDLTVGWSPRKAMYVCHAYQDNCVPFACYQSLKSKMSGNPNITWEVIRNEDHSNDGTYFYMRLILGMLPLE